jgi:RNA polymerase sigma-70 factor (ECF subfamily)
MEHELLRELQNGNAFAQKRVYDRYAHRLFRLCLRYVQNEDDARDVLMTGFLKFFKNADRIEHRGDAGFEPYLKALMVNEALQFLRKKRDSWVALDESTDAEADAGSLPDAGLAAEALYDLVRQLPTGYRTVFNLYALEGYSHAEIARRLGISEQTSKSQLSKARALLRRRLHEIGYDHAQRTR